MSSAAQSHVVPGAHFYDGVWYAGRFPKESLDRVKTFEFRDDDTVLVTYPKSGTTWMAQLLHSLKQLDKENPVDYVADSKDGLEYIEMVPPKGLGLGLQYYTEILDATPSPRMMKSHLDVKFFKRVLDSDQKTKFVVVMRNVKDALVSYYHFYRANAGLGRFKGTFPEWMDMYKQHRMQDWFDWNLGWWQYKDHPNVIFFKFEEMKKDLPREIRRLVAFLGRRELSDAEMESICKKASFGAMSQHFAKLTMLNRVIDPKISPFIRKGQVGDWKNYFDDDLNQYIDDIYEARVKGTGLELDFE